jgi:hypothetical protein
MRPAGGGREQPAPEARLGSRPGLLVFSPELMLGEQAQQVVESISPLAEQFEKPELSQFIESYFPKSSHGAGCHRCCTSDLGTTVRQRPLASTVVGGDCYSVGYSVTRVVLADRECPLIIMASGLSVGRGRGRLPMGHSGWNKAGHPLPCGAT